jgi:uncharacterized RDD family membrane protein YckC
VTAATEQEWPGQRLGLPSSGPGSAAGWGRRVVALLIDWVLSTLVASAFTGRSVASPPLGAERWLPLAIFAFEVCVLTMTVGGSAGQLVTRVTIRRLSGERLDPLRALGRTLLICLAIPPLIFNRDQRGLHDLAVGSVAVRR